MSYGASHWFSSSMLPRLFCSATCCGSRTGRAVRRRYNQVTCQPKQPEEKVERMQEDDKEASESQPEPEEQPPSESAADESQPTVGTQPPPATPLPLPPTQGQKRWQYFLSLVLGLIPMIVFLVGYGIALGTAGGGLNAISTSLIGLILYIVELIIT